MSVSFLRATEEKSLRALVEDLRKKLNEYATENLDMQRQIRERGTGNGRHYNSLVSLLFLFLSCF